MWEVKPWTRSWLSAENDRTDDGIGTGKTRYPGAMHRQISPASTRMSGQICCIRARWKSFRASGLMNRQRSVPFPRSALFFTGTGSALVKARTPPSTRRSPFGMSQSQAHTEATLEAHLEALGGTVERDVTLTALAQDEGRGAGDLETRRWRGRDRPLPVGDRLRWGPQRCASPYRAKRFQAVPMTFHTCSVMF